MGERAQLRHWYDTLAEKYEEKLSFCNYAKVISTVILTTPFQNMPPCPVFLDLGCGTGLATAPLLERFPQAQITGLDLSSEMLKIYRQRFPSSQTLLADFNSSDSIPLKPNSLDGIFTTGALSEYGNLERALPLAYSLLKEEGLLLNLGIRNNVFGYISGFFWRYIPLGLKKFTAACKNTGFRQVEKIPIPLLKHPIAKVHKFVIKATK